MLRDCPTCLRTPTLLDVPHPHPSARCEVFARACADCGQPFTYDGLTWPWAAAETGVIVGMPVAAPLAV